MAHDAFYLASMPESKAPPLTYKLHDQMSLVIPTEHHPRTANRSSSLSCHAFQMVGYALYSTTLAFL